jgi:hypothetical protein
VDEISDQDENAKDVKTTVCVRNEIENRNVAFRKLVLEATREYETGKHISRTLIMVLFRQCSLLFLKAERADTTAQTKIDPLNTLCSTYLYQHKKKMLSTQIKREIDQYLLDN